MRHRAGDPHGLPHGGPDQRFFYALPVEVGLDLTDPGSALTAEYERRYQRFRQTLARTVLPEGLDAGLFYTTQLAAFHAQQMGWEPEPQTADLTNPLFSVAYVPPSPQRVHHLDYAKEVRDALVDYPWIEVYGLDYLDTLNLPYSVFNDMLADLKRRFAKRASQPPAQPSGQTPT